MKSNISLIFLLLFLFSFCKPYSDETIDDAQWEMYKRLLLCQKTSKYPIKGVYELRQTNDCFSETRVKKERSFWVKSTLIVDIKPIKKTTNGDTISVFYDYFYNDTCVVPYLYSMPTAITIIDNKVSCIFEGDIGFSIENSLPDSYLKEYVLENSTIVNKKLLKKAMEK